MTEKNVNIKDAALIPALFGELDVNIEIIETEYCVRIINYGEQIKIVGENPANVECAAGVMSHLQDLTAVNGILTEQNVRYAICMANDGQINQLKFTDDDLICITARGKPIKAKTVGQKNYVSAIKKNTITLGIGPAGTGKTFLAVAAAVSALRHKTVNRIILTRPAVEAGEKLGYLPGDLRQKIDPYLRPLYDALYETLGFETYQKYVERGIIEIAPLAYMRGRTLDDSFIILDEAQNTTPAQMKMFLTRLGFNSKAVVTGDITQVDLPYGTESGLMAAARILKDIDDIAIHYFTEKDVVRHKLVMKIISAYEKHERAKTSVKEKYNMKKFKRLNK